jgi:phosphoribosyl 1,2-cyclic phosphodiesterase
VALFLVRHHDRPGGSGSRTIAIDITFLGTRGEIKLRSRRHFRHSALMVREGDTRVMIDCGTDWLGRIRALGPTAIVLTHAHADHAAGLAKGAPCPVFATAETWSLIDRFPIDDRHVIRANVPFRIGKLRFEAVPVEHSLRAPAVGYRVSRGRTAFFYVPDVAALPGPANTLRGVALYVGDGATVTRSMVRHRDHHLIGHAPVLAQLRWCADAGVSRAIFTHCGSGIVRSDPRAIADKVKRLGEEQGVVATLAHDGLVVALGA